MKAYGLKRYHFCCPGHASEISKYSGCYAHLAHKSRALYLRNKYLKHRARQQGKHQSKQIDG